MHSLPPSQLSPLSTLAMIASQPKGVHLFRSTPFAASKTVHCQATVLQKVGKFRGWARQRVAGAGSPACGTIVSDSKKCAELVGVANDLGTLQVGKWADLLVLTANPLVDIRNARKIEQVMIAGNAIER